MQTKTHTWTHRCMHSPPSLLLCLSNPHTHTLVLLSLSHTHQNTCAAEENDPVTPFCHFFSPSPAHISSLDAFHYSCPVLSGALGLPKKKKAPERVSTQMSLMLGNLVNTPEREGELPACLPAPWLLLCAAHSLSPQELKPSPRGFFGGDSRAKKWRGGKEGMERASGGEEEEEDHA